MTFDQMMRAVFISGYDTKSIAEIALAVTVPFLLSFVLAFVYRKPQRNTNYSVGFVQSMFLFSSLAAVLTIVVGSNLPRAIGLIGS